MNKQLFTCAAVAFLVMGILSEAGGQGTLLADSLNDWSTVGEQGANDWQYGYYDLRADVERGDGVYSGDEFIPFLNDGSGAVSSDGSPGAWQSSTNHWSSSTSKWDLVDNGAGGDGPWTEITPRGGHPAANVGGDPEVHWAIRRWTSSVSGEVDISGNLNHLFGNGDGVAGRIFHNGQEIWNGTSVSNNELAVQATAVVAPGDTVDCALDCDASGVFDRGDPASLDLIDGGFDQADFIVTIRVAAVADDSDSDGDGVVALAERALGMDLGTPDRHLLPTVSLVPSGGSQHLGITHRRLRGGSADPVTGAYVVDTAAGEIHYSIWTTDDLDQWTDATSVPGALVEVSAAPDPTDPLVETVTLRLADEIAATGLQEYMQLRFTRFPPP